MKFIQVIPRFGAGHPSNGYIRGKSASGQMLQHPPQLTVYATEAGVVMTQELLDKIKLMGCVFNPDVIIPVEQLSELNRQPSLIAATVVELTAAEQPPNGDGTVEKPLRKMNKTELQAKATELGIEFGPADTVAVLIELIEGKLEG